MVTRASSGEGITLARTDIMCIIGVATVAAIGAVDRLDT